MALLFEMKIPVLFMLSVLLKEVEEIAKCRKQNGGESHVLSAFPRSLRTLKTNRYQLYKSGDCNH